MAGVPLYYIAGFSTSGTTQSMTIDAAANDTTVAAGTYAHQTFAAVAAASGYTAFSAAVVTALNVSLAGTYHCDLTIATGLTTSSTGFRYSIYRDTAGFTLSFPATAAGARTKAALGFTNNSPSGAGTAGSPYVSDVRPLYVMYPEMAGRTEFSDVFEPDDIVDEAVSDGGTPHAVSKQTSELWCDWSQAMEPLAATFTRSAATATVPWTWQAMIKHCRGQHPFGVYESAGVGSYTVHKFRAEGATFRPNRYVSDYNGLWSIPFLTRDLGSLV